MKNNSETYVVAYQDENNTPHFLKTESGPRWTDNPMEANIFPSWVSAKSAQARAEITHFKFGLVVLTFESIKKSTPHWIEDVLDEAARV